MTRFAQKTAGARPQRRTSGAWIVADADARDGPNSRPAYGKQNYTQNSVTVYAVPTKV